VGELFVPPKEDLAGSGACIALFRLREMLTGHARAGGPRNGETVVNRFAVFFQSVFCMTETVDCTSSKVAFQQQSGGEAGFWKKILSMIVGHRKIADLHVGADVLFASLMMQIEKELLLYCITAAGASKICTIESSIYAELMCSTYSL
jgi:hypothetical protein